MKKRAAITILDAIADKALFAPWFKKEATWKAWFVFLSALCALPMTEEQLAVYRACTGRTEPPTTPATEAWLVCGRRAGKSFILALIAVYLACFHSYRQQLAPGERATILVVAADRKQARVIMRYVRGLLTNVAMLARMIEREAAESFDLDNGVTIEVGTVSFRSTRGYTIVAALLDELAFWPTDDSANPDSEVIAAIRPGMVTIPGAMLLCASSPYARRGSLYDAYRKHHGQNGDPVLIWQAATRTMNGTVPQAVIDEAYERDPSSAAAEYGAMFRADVETLLTLEVVDAATVPGRCELAPISSLKYVAFVDPSGGSAELDDVGHRAPGPADKTRCGRRRAREKAAVLPDQVAKEFTELLRSYRVRTVTGDRYGGEWPRERFRAHGIAYALAEKPKSDIYGALCRSSTPAARAPRPAATGGATGGPRAAHRPQRPRFYRSRPRRP